MDLCTQSFLSLNQQDTAKFSQDLGSQIPVNSIVCLHGNLGAGKTTFMKGFVHGINGYPCEDVTSPTFTYLHIYEGSPPVYHIDLYRLKNRSTQTRLDFECEEYFYQNNIVCIEWSELLPFSIPHAIHIYLEHQNQENQRLIRIEVPQC